MDSIVVTGGTELNGEIPIAGAKNTCLKLMCAALLTDEPLTLTNVPPVTTIESMAAAPPLATLTSLESV